MDERFTIKEIFICPVAMTAAGTLKYDLNYPTRYCVIDNENEIAIDIKTKLKYDYVKTISHLYFVNKLQTIIKDNARVAIFPYASIFSYEYDVKEAKNIIERLKNNEEFQDGNEVYDNKEYLEHLKQEELKLLEQQNTVLETKKLRKRRK